MKWNLSRELQIALVLALIITSSTTKELKRSENDAINPWSNPRRRIAPKLRRPTDSPKTKKHMNDENYPSHLQNFQDISELSHFFQKPFGKNECSDSWNICHTNGPQTNFKIGKGLENILPVNYGDSGYFNGHFRPQNLEVHDGKAQEEKVSNFQFQEPNLRNVQQFSGFSGYGSFNGHRRSEELNSGFLGRQSLVPFFPFGVSRIGSPLIGFPLAPFARPIPRFGFERLGRYFPPELNIYQIPQWNQHRQLQNFQRGLSDFKGYNVQMLGSNMGNDFSNDKVLNPSNGTEENSEIQGGNSKNKESEFSKTALNGKIIKEYVAHDSFKFFKS